MSPGRLRLRNFWVFLWIAGCILGFIGTFVIIGPLFGYVSNIFTVTLVFFILPIQFAIVFGIFRYCHCDSTEESREEQIRNFSRAMLVVPFATVTVLGLPYMDWILGVVAGNLAGVPGKGNSLLFWAYFAVKRLGFLAV